MIPGVFIITCPDPPKGPFHIVHRWSDGKGGGEFWHDRLPEWLPRRARLAALVLREYGEIDPHLRAIIEACTPEEDEA